MKLVLFALYNFMDWLQWKTGWLFGSLCRGRHTEWLPVECEECGWYGPVRWTEHGYGDDGSGEDVVPEDYCPKCGVTI